MQVHASEIVYSLESLDSMLMSMIPIFDESYRTSSTRDMMVKSQWEEPLLQQSNQTRVLINTIQDSTKCEVWTIPTMAPRALEPLTGKAPEQFQQRSDLFFFRRSTETETRLQSTVCAHAHELITAHARACQICRVECLTTSLFRHHASET